MSTYTGTGQSDTFHFSLFTLHCPVALRAASELLTSSFFTSYFFSPTDTRLEAASPKKSRKSCESCRKLFAGTFDSRRHRHRTSQQGQADRRFRGTRRRFRGSRRRGRRGCGRNRRFSRGLRPPAASRRRSTSTVPRAPGWAASCKGCLCGAGKGVRGAVRDISARSCEGW